MRGGGWLERLPIRALRQYERGEIQPCKPMPPRAARTGGEHTMKTKKRFLSILLSLVLVLGLFPGMSLTAYAASTTVTWNPSDIVPEHPWDDFFTKDVNTYAALIKLFI